jgi:F0F1-type ATP synthase membrane subunit c/vacuolar-type H+-ATPase subunit K
MSTQIHFPRGRKMILPLLMGLTLFLFPIGKASALTLADESGALGIARLCAGLLEATGRNPEMKLLFQRIYRAGLQDIMAVKKVAKPEKVAEAIGIIRGAQIVFTGRNPSAAVVLKGFAKECYSDIEMLKGKKSYAPF